MDIKENVKNIDVWTRGLFILIFAVIFYFLFFLIWLVVIFQFLMKLITNELNDQLLDFSDGLTNYVSRILLYITFKSEEQPFPFSPWTNQTVTRKPPGKKTAKKKTARKITKKSTIDTDIETDDSSKPEQ